MAIILLSRARTLGREMFLNLIYPFRQNNLSVRRQKRVIITSKTKTSSTSTKDFSIFLPFSNSELSEQNEICFSALNVALPRERRKSENDSRYSRGRTLESRMIVKIHFMRCGSFSFPLGAWRSKQREREGEREKKEREKEEV